MSATSPTLGPAAGPTGGSTTDGRSPGMLPTDVLRLLADPLRARIVGLLAHESLCTCHLVDETGASQTNISNHLRLLRESGLVSTEPCGRYTYYRLRPEALRALAGVLSGLAETAAAHAGVRRPCS